MTEARVQKSGKTVIFGGSFDPVHYGHVDIVKNLEKTFDRVIVVPSFVSPFKAGADDAAVRFKLCKRIFSSDKTEVCKYEINKKGVSYSVDTAAYLAKKFAGDKLFWAIGSEELTRLTEWRDIDRLKALVTFFVIPRPNFAVNDERIKELKKRKIKIKIANFDGLDISSTEIKIDAAFGKSNKYVPSVVVREAKKTGAFNPYGKYVAALYRNGLSAHRIEHTYGVAVRGAELAKLYGANVNDTVIACLLHDIAKSVDISSYADKYDAELFPDPLAHAAIGSELAVREFGVSSEIAHAVYTHGTGSDDMSLIGEIVYLADKTEAGRRYDSVDYLRYLCELDKDVAVYTTIKEVHEWAMAKHNSRDSLLTLCALDKYAQKIKGKSFPSLEEYDAFALADRRKAAEAYTEQKNATDPSDKILSAREQLDRLAEELSDPTYKNIATIVAAELDLHKAVDVDIIDLDGKTIVADYFVIASATSSTAVKALGGYVEDRLTKTYGIDPTRRDTDKEWLALDYGGVIVHIFTQKTREFYNIERLWTDGTNVKRYGD